MKQRTMEVWRAEEKKEEVEREAAGPRERRRIGRLVGCRSSSLNRTGRSWSSPKTALYCTSYVGRQADQNSNKGQPQSSPTIQGKRVATAGGLFAAVGRKQVHGLDPCSAERALGDHCHGAGKRRRNGGASHASMRSHPALSSPKP